LRFARVFRGFRQVVGRFLVVRVLVLGESVDLHVGLPVDDVHLHEATVRQLSQQAGDVALVVRQHLGLDLGVPALHPAVPVNQRPQPGEEQPGQRGAFGQLVV
jgi:hypothetical protein